MNNDIRALKEYIKLQYSIGNLKHLWEQIVAHKRHIKQLNAALWESELEQEQAINHSIKLTQSYIINLQNQFNNLISNSSGRNLMIFLNDGSRFIVNTDILNYMASQNYITDELMLSLVEDNDTTVIPYNFFEKIKTDNELIPQLIGISEHQIILNDICLDSRQCSFKLTNYLVNENMLKMLLLEFTNLDLSFGQVVDFNQISLIYKSITLSTRNIIYTLQEFLQKSSCCFMFVIKKNKVIFGWILQTIYRHKDIQEQNRVLLLFKIIEDVLYTFQPVNYYFNINLNLDKSPYMSITEEKYVDTSLSDGTVENILDITNILYSYDDNVDLYVDQNFGKKTLANLDIEHNFKIDQIQIYELHGQLYDSLLEIIKKNLNSQVFLSEQNPTSVLKTFNYTIETIKQIYKKITETDAAIDDRKCDNRYCPIYHPYLCDKESNFRNNFGKNWQGKPINKGHSKGNNAPCVSDKRFCDMAYMAATTAINTENISMKSTASRIYSSKPIYCKIDQTIENKQEYNSDGGKYTLSKIKIRKTSKKQKRSKNQKRSKKQKKV